MKKFNKKVVSAYLVKHCSKRQGNFAQNFKGCLIVILQKNFNCFLGNYKNYRAPKRKN
jgi:hypothetical protein